MTPEEHAREMARLRDERDRVAAERARQQQLMAEQRATQKRGG